MTMNPFEQNEHLLHFLTSQVEREVIDYIRQEMQHGAPGSIPTEEELFAFFQSPDEPTKLDAYQQMLATDKLLEYAEISPRTLCDLIRYQQLKEFGIVHSAKEFIQLFHPDEQEDKITYADGSYVDAEGGTLSSTGLYWTDKAGKISISGISGTVVVTEVQTIPGYTIDENTRAQTVVVNPNDTQTLHFYNTPIGGVEIIKVNEDNHSERIPNTTFEIRKVDDALVDTVTTDKNGRVFVALEDGSYYAKEVTSNKSFRLDDTPHYQVLASNLLTGNNYSFSLNAIPMQAGEVVTDIYFDFGKVPVGFQSVVNPTLSVMVNGNAVNGYQMVNRADVGGKYQGTWQTATASWVTIIRRLWNTPTLPKTGY